MGAGKLQERDVVASLRVLRVLLSEVPVLPPGIVPLLPGEVCGLQDTLLPSATWFAGGASP